MSPALNTTVEGDESGNRRHSMGFRQTRSPAPKTSLGAASAVRPMLVGLCDAKGINHS